MKEGGKRTFNFAKNVDFEIKEVIENANLPFDWQWKICKCPKCDTDIVSNKTYTIDKVEVLESKDGDRIMLGYTKELIGDKPLTMRLPDKDFYVEKDMTEAVTGKSKYLKEKTVNVVKEKVVKEKIGE